VRGVSTAEHTNGTLSRDPHEALEEGKPLPNKTKVDIDLAHRLMLEEYIGWYYPGVRPSLHRVVNELIGIAWGNARNDPQRPETPDERRQRLTGQTS
jgi:hypothetical protein